MPRWPYGTAAWQRLRTAKLSATPLCEVCIRREVVEPAVAVDHIIAIEKGGEPFPPLSGLMSMCEPCHNSKTNAVDHPNASGFRRALKGFDADGNPIDPQGWERAPAATPAAPVAPGAFKGREVTAREPAWDTRKDLVSCESFATGNQEAESWV